MSLYEFLAYEMWFIWDWYEIRESEGSFGIAFISKFFDDSQFAGTLTLLYSIDVLDKMISPLYEDESGSNKQDFNIFIYANFVEWNTFT